VAIAIRLLKEESVLVAKTNAFPSKEAIFVCDPSAFIDATFVPLS